MNVWVESRVSKPSMLLSDLWGIALKRNFGVIIFHYHCGAVLLKFYALLEPFCFLLWFTNVNNAKLMSLRLRNIVNPVCLHYHFVIWYEVQLSQLVCSFDCFRSWKRIYVVSLTVGLNIVHGRTFSIVNFFIVCKSFKSITLCEIMSTKISVVHKASVFALNIRFHELVQAFLEADQVYFSLFQNTATQPENSI